MLSYRFFGWRIYKGIFVKHGLFFLCGKEEARYVFGGSAQIICGIFKCRLHRYHCALDREYCADTLIICLPYFCVASAEHSERYSGRCSVAGNAVYHLAAYALRIESPLAADNKVGISDVFGKLLCFKHGVDTACQLAAEHCIYAGSALRSASARQSGNIAAEVA